MRILVITNLYPPDSIGGYELLCHHAVEALRARGHEVWVITSSPRCLPSGRGPQVFRRFTPTEVWDQRLVAPQDERARAFATSKSSYVNPTNVYQLLTTLEELRPDVVYLWNLSGLGGIGIAATVAYLQVPWVWELMDAVPLGLCSWKGRVMPALAAEFSRQMRGHYIAVSRHLREEIVNGGVALKGEVRILPAWIAGPRRPLDRAWFRGGRLRLAFAGWLSPAKGVPIVLEAASLVRSAGYSNFSIDLFGLSVAGDFRDTIGALGLVNHVRMRGVLPQAELTEIYDQYDIFIFPTWSREPFGCAPLEAAAYGCVPLIPADCGLAEWLVDSVHCLKAERTPEAFAAVLLDVLRGNVELEPIGRRAAAAAREQFHVSRVIVDVERTLSDAVASARPAPPESTDDLVRLAIYADHLMQTLVQEAVPIC